MVTVNAYDTGDMVEFRGDFSTIKQISLLTTRAQMMDGRHIVVSNSSLLNKEIVNYTRSGAFQFMIDVYVDISTPPARIQAFREDVASLVQRDPAVPPPPPPIFLSDTSPLSIVFLTDADMEVYQSELEGDRTYSQRAYRHLGGDAASHHLGCTPPPPPSFPVSLPLTRPRSLLRTLLAIKLLLTSSP